MSRLNFFSDRIANLSVLLVACFGAVLVLPSQSAASFVTYILALVILLSVRQWSDVRNIGFFWLIIATLVYFTLTAFWSEPFVWRDVFSVFVRALLIACFVVAFGEVTLRGDMQIWLRRALTSVGLLAIFAAFTIYVIENPPHGRMNGLGQLDTAVVAALVFGVVIVMALQMVIRERGFWRYLALVAMLAGIFAVYLSDSRNAWVAVAAGVCVLAVAESTNDRFRFVASMSLLVVIAGVVLVALYLSPETRGLLLPRGFSFRPEIWSLAIERIAAGNIWFGLGINTPDDFPVAGQIMQHPHSLYLATLYQGGFIGLGLFLLLLWRSCVEFFVNYENSDAKLGLAVLGIAIPAYTLDGYELLDKIGANWMLVWIPVAIALGLKWSRQLRDY